MSFLTFGPYRLDPAQKLLFRGEEEILLPPKTFDTLRVLIENRGRVVAKEELMRAVWPDTVVEENNLTQNISKLRKLFSNGSRSEFIETLPRRGYRFTAEVSEGVDVEYVQMRRRRVSGRMVASTLALAVVTLAPWALALRGSRSETAARFRDLRIEPVTTSGRAVVSAISPDGSYVVYARDDGGKQSLQLRQIASESDVEIMAGAPVDYWGLTVSPNGKRVYYTAWDRNATDARVFVMPLLGGAASLVVDDGAGPVGCSPDGTRIAYTIDRGSTRDSRLMVASADGRDVRTLHRGSADDMLGSISSGPAWSPDGSIILVAAASRSSSGREKYLLAVNTISGQATKVAGGPWYGIGPLVWLKDGRGVLLSGSDRPGAPRQIWHLSWPDGVARPVTHDLHDYGSLGLTSDSRTVTALQVHTASTLVVRAGDGVERDVATQVGDQTGAEGITWTRDGRIVYATRGAAGFNLHVVGLDGKASRQLTSHAGSNFHPSASPDGRYVVFASDRSGALNLWRLDLAAGTVRQVTSGSDSVRPSVSADGRWIVYQQGHGWVTTTVWKAPMEGGDPVPLTTTNSIRPTVSPDGTKIAYYAMDRQGWSLAVMPTSGGPPLHRFPIPQTSSRVMRWMPDGTGVAYVDDREESSNIWVQPLDGRAPIRLVRVASGRTGAFDWSPDGQLAYVRVTRTSDVVRIRPAGG